MLFLKIIFIIINIFLLYLVIYIMQSIAPLLAPPLLTVDSQKRGVFPFSNQQNIDQKSQNKHRSTAVPRKHWRTSQTAFSIPDPDSYQDG